MNKRSKRTKNKQIIYKVSSQYQDRDLARSRSSTIKHEMAAINKKRSRDSTQWTSSRVYKISRARAG
ncbi:hypothetical protein BDW72DRAFT_9589 [Aspergillus terricola var. indicus]